MFELTFRRLRIAIALVLVLAQPALAELSPGGVVMVPSECLPYWNPPHSAATDWNRMLSLAACIQDTSVETIEDAAELPAFVDRLAERLLPSLSLYAMAAQSGPGPVKLRAVYQIGMAELSLIQRARQSVHTPALRRDLAELLEPSAIVAMLAFAAVVHVATLDPAVAPDAPSKYMVRHARELLEQMAPDWGEVTTEGVRLAEPSTR
ncbi:MAG: hypothetical protein AB7T06_01270 [Kofleriaceae bacterium]